MRGIVVDHRVTRRRSRCRSGRTVERAGSDSRRAPTGMVTRPGDLLKEEDGTEFRFAYHPTANRLRLLVPAPRLPRTRHGPHRSRGKARLHTVLARATDGSPCPPPALRGDGRTGRRSLCPHADAFGRPGSVAPGIWFARSSASTSHGKTKPWVASGSSCPRSRQWSSTNPTWRVSSVPRTHALTEMACGNR